MDPTRRDGVEYPTPVGKIDILTIDEDETFYVFELKWGRGRDKVVGQVTRYMGWVSDTIGKDKLLRLTLGSTTLSQNLPTILRRNS